jgi:hypothetical protein
MFGNRLDRGLRQGIDIVLFLDPEPLSDALEQADGFGRLILGQHVNLQIDVVAPVRLSNGTRTCMQPTLRKIQMSSPTV